MLILTPYAGFLLQMALSRSREYLADMEAATLLESSHPLVSALVKIERHNHRLKRRFLRWPMAELPSGSLLRTHPPTRERVRRLMAIEAGSGHPEVLPARPATFSQLYRLRHLNAHLDQCRRYGLCH